MRPRCPAWACLLGQRRTFTAEMSGMQKSGRNFWIGIFLLTLLLRAPSLYTEVLDPDEAGHAVHVGVWLDGGTPYVDFIDNKQPLFYATYAAIFTLLGRSLLAVHAVTIPWLVFTAFLLCRLARAVWGSPLAGRAAALVFTFFGTAYLEKDMLASNTEVLMNLPLAAAFLVALGGSRDGPRGRAAFVAGLLAGLATLYNLKAGIALPLLALIVLLEGSDRWRHGLPASLLLGVGALLPWGVTCLAFWAGGALHEMIYWNFLLNRKYADAGVPLWLIDFRRGILYGFPRLLLFLLATIVAWAAAGAALLAPPRDARPRRQVRWIGLWLAASFAPVCIGGRLYGHYFIQLLPPLALLAAGPLARWLAGLGPFAVSAPDDPLASGPEEPQPRYRLRPVRTALLLAGALVPVCGLTVAGHLRIARGELDGLRPEVGRVAAYVRGHTCPDDRLFIWGYWSPVYYYARRPPATRFVYPQTLAGYVPGNPKSLDPGADTSSYIVPGHWEDFFDDMQAHPAELLLDVAPAAIHFWEKYPIDAYPRLAELIRQRYDREAVVDGVVIYRLRGGKGQRTCPG